jgi:hypothetical protein
MQNKLKSHLDQSRQKNPDQPAAIPIGPQKPEAEAPAQTDKPAVKKAAGEKAE